jgi:hypothetical protein
VRKIVVEELNLVSALCLLFYRKNTEEAIYLSASSLFESSSVIRFLSTFICLRRTRFADFPGTYFLVLDEAITSATERFYKVHRKGNLFIEFVLRFRNHAKMEMALKKELLRSYVTNRVKAHVLAKRIVDDHPDHRILFFPIDGVDFSRLLSEPLVCSPSALSVPAVVRFGVRVQGILGCLSFILYAHRLLVSLLVYPGLCLRRPRKQSFDVACDMHDVPPTLPDTYEGREKWHKSSKQTFMYDSTVLRQESVLHVFRWRIPSKSSRRFFEQSGLPFAELGNTRIPLGYFIKRVLWHGYLRFVYFGIRNLLSGGTNGWCIGPAYRVVANLVRNEVLFSAYDIKVFIGRDEGVFTHIVRSLALETIGCQTVGFAHGDYIFPSFPTAYVCMDTFCIWGDYNKSLYRNCEIGRFEVIGGGMSSGLDDTANRPSERARQEYASQIEQFRIVVACDSSFQPDLYNTSETNDRFYRQVISLLNEFDDIFVVFKPKAKHVSQDHFEKLVESTAPDHRDRVTIEPELGFYEMLSIADLVVVIHNSTVGLEGLMAGVKVLYFDVTDSFRGSAYVRYDEHLVSFTDEAFLRNVKWVMKDGYYLPQSLLDQIVRDHAFKFDGRVSERFRGVVYDSLKAANNKQPETEYQK